jgi:TIR domain/NACHT domain
MLKEPIMAALTLFYSYAYEDEALRDQLEKHLVQLQRQELISSWHDRKIPAGGSFADEIDTHLETASIVLLLVSPDFLASSYCYEIEMQRVLERHRLGLARVVPIILRPCDWQHSPLKDLQCLPRNGLPVIQWQYTDDAFNTITQSLRSMIEQQARPFVPLSPQNRQNRMRMLKQVRTIWIDGLLTQSLRHAARIELYLQDRPDVLANSWQLQYQELDQVPKRLPDGTAITQVYDSADGELLILGEPGAGKTTLLLELVCTLLERAEKDERFPVPMVFNLSSWAEKRQSLRIWLGEELRTKYQIPRKIAQRWIDDDQVMPLLDGLDEVAEDARSACVEQINAYYLARLERGSSPIVVCCRSEEYTALPTRVILQSAVSILPLTSNQINTYLEQAGEQVRGLRQALDEDTELHNLARQPLMLNIFTLTYQGVNRREFPTVSAHEQVLHVVFGGYVKRMLSRRKPLNWWKTEQVVYYLSFLARQMRCHDQTVFFVENLQPDWLSNEPHQRLYLGLVGALLGAFFGAIFLGLVGGIIAGLTSRLHWLNPWPQLQPEVMIPILFLIFGAILSFFFGGALGLMRNIKQVRIRPAELLNWSWKIMQLTLAQSLMIGCVAGLLNWRLTEPIVHPYSPLSVAAGDTVPERALLAWSIYEVIDLLIGGVIYVLVSQIRTRFSTPLEQTLKRDVGQGICVGLIIGLFTSLLDGLTGGPINDGFTHPLGTFLFTPLGQLIVGGSSGILAGGIFGMMIGLSRNRLAESDRIVANQGIHRSLQYSIRFGIVIWLLFWAIYWLLGGPAYKWLLGLIFGLLVGLLFGLLNGGIASIQHALLRYFLWRGGSTPLNYVRFLDVVSERLLLRKVGGGYIFVHRLLLEYFADLEENDGPYRP